MLVFTAGLRKVETKLDGEIQEAWRPKAIYNYIQDRFIEPDFVVDVTPFVDTKMDAIKAFSSQFYNEGSNEPESPLTMKNFFEFVRARMADMGRYIQVDYAEGFLVRTTGRSEVAKRFTLGFSHLSKYSFQVNKVLFFQ